MMCPMQSCNTGVGGADHGNRETYKFTFCYLAKFYDEDGRFLCMEPFTTTAKNADDALETIDDDVQKHCEEFDYFEADIQLEDVC